MDREAFYAYLRSRNSDLFGTSLSQRQVDGMEALLDALDGFSIDHASHVLAESYHETGGGMYPVKETVFRHSKDQNPSDTTVIARLDRAWAAGNLSWVSHPYWRDGWFGRGQIQITHQDNYLKASALTGVDLEAGPDKALDPKISAMIAAEGCRAGMFTGKKLSDFDGDEYDHYNARAIVNGDKRLNGGKIKQYALSFKDALEIAGWDEKPEEPEPALTPPSAGIIPLTALFRDIVEMIASMGRKSS